MTRPWKTNPVLFQRRIQIKTKTEPTSSDKLYNNNLTYLEATTHTSPQCQSLLHNDIYTAVHATKQLKASLVCFQVCKSYSVNKYILWKMLAN